MNITYLVHWLDNISLNIGRFYDAQCEISLKVQPFWRQNWRVIFQAFQFRKSLGWLMSFDRCQVWKNESKWWPRFQNFQGSKIVMTVMFLPQFMSDKQINVEWIISTWNWVWNIDVWLSRKVPDSWSYFRFIFPPRTSNSRIELTQTFTKSKPLKNDPAFLSSKRPHF